MTSLPHEPPISEVAEDAYLSALARAAEMAAGATSRPLADIVAELELGDL